jgi:ribonuclease BN (tRNA processing enzyme)
VPRAGIASAITVDGAVCLADFGYGAVRRLKAAGVDLGGLRAGFLTHQHSDHVGDLGNLLLYGWYQNLGAVDRPVELYGPGDRGGVPPVAHGVEEPPVVNPDQPTPGFAAMVGGLMRA